MNKFKKIFMIISLICLLLVISGCSKKIEINSEIETIEDSTDTFIEDLNKDIHPNKEIIKSTIQQPKKIIPNTINEIESNKKEQPMDMQESKKNEDIDSGKSGSNNSINKNHEILIHPYEFVPNTLTIKVGDEVTFNNVREGRLKLAYLVGTQGCNNLKSPMLNTGDTYTYTFPEKITCVVVDAITKQYSIKIKVE